LEHSGLVVSWSQHSSLFVHHDPLPVASLKDHSNDDMRRYEPSTSLLTYISFGFSGLHETRNDNCRVIQNTVRSDTVRYGPCSTYISLQLLGYVWLATLRKIAPTEPTKKNRANQEWPVHKTTQSPYQTRFHTRPPCKTKAQWLPS
jgi:hypothetical protein